MVVVQLGLRGDSQLRINCVTPVCNRCTARMKRHQGEGGRGGGGLLLEGCTKQHSLGLDSL